MVNRMAVTHGADDYVAPIDGNIWNEFVDQRKENGDGGQGQNYVAYFAYEGGPSGQEAHEIVLKKIRWRR